MIVLPVISVLFVFVLIQFYQESIHGKVDSRTLSMLYSIAVNTFIILLSNEALSVFHVLRLCSLLLLWLAVDFMLFIILLRLFFWCIRSVSESDVTCCLLIWTLA